MAGAEIKCDVTGDRELIAVLKMLPTDLQAYALEPAIRKAARTLAQAEKAAAPSRSGLLAQSIGIAKIRVYPRKGVVWGAAGPRKGFKRALEIKAGRLKFASKKRTAKLGDDAKTANPVRYAHLAGPGRHQQFMTAAQDSVQSSVQTQVQEDIRKGIERSVQRLAKRS